MKLLRRMNKSNSRKNSGFTLVELVIVMAIMGILGLAVVGFIGTSTKQYKYASKDVDLQYEAQLTMNQIGDLIIDAQKGVKYEPATVAAPVEVASEPLRPVILQLHQRKKRHPKRHHPKKHHLRKHHPTAS